MSFQVGVFQTNFQQVINAVASVVGGGKKRKLRILPDGTRLYATEREVRQLLSKFYQVKPVEKRPPKLRIKDIQVSVDLVTFDKHVPKVYELKHEYKKFTPNYRAYLKAIEEEEFITLLYVT